MAFIGRLFVIIFALFAAILAAGIAVAIALLGPDWHGFAGDVGDRAVSWIAVFFTTGFVGAVGFLPAVIMIAIAETFKIRSLLVHAAAGAAVIFLGYYGNGLSQPYEESIDRAPPPISRNAEIAAAAGIVFGLTYWLIAGRRAGAWRE